MINLYRTLLITTSVALSACSLTPPHETPSLPVANAYPDTEGTQAAEVKEDGNIVNVTNAAQVAWREYFTDSTLQSLIDQALTNNRDLRQAVLRVQEARAAYGIQRAEQFPTLTANAGGVRGLIPADLSLTGQEMTASLYHVGVGMMAWELDFWGRVSNLKEAALERYLATDEARRAATIGLIAQVSDTYLALREMDERIALAGETLKTRQDSFHIFKRRYEMGSTAKIDLVQVETLLHQAEALLAQLKQTREMQANGLALLIGSPLPSLPQKTVLNEVLSLKPLRIGLPSELLLQRPDIMAAEHQLRASEASIGAARAAFFPRISLTGFLGTASDELSGLFKSGSDLWVFQPSLSLPIFDSGRNKASLSVAEVRRDMSVAHYEKTIQTAFREVADALSAQHWLAEQVKIAQATLKAQSERTRLAQLRYDNGSSAYFELLDAQRDLLNTEQQLVQVRRALLANHVSLYAALGGGSQLLDETPLIHHQDQHHQDKE